MRFLCVFPTDPGAGEARPEAEAGRRGGRARVQGVRASVRHCRAAQMPRGAARQPEERRARQIHHHRTTDRTEPTPHRPTQRGNIPPSQPPVNSVVNAHPSAASDGARPH